MVWRKLDNWTAFTDGYRTWINGPHGLQARLNTETFDWEASPPPTPTPAPTPVPDFGAWQFHDYTDLLTGTVTKRVFLQATDVQGSSGDLPHITMRCDLGNVGEFDIIIDWYTHIGQNNDVRDGIHDISYRFDRRAITDFVGVASEDQESTFMVIDDNMNSLYGGLAFGGFSRLAVQVTRYDGNTVTAVWDITGALSAYEKVRDSC